MMTHVPHRYFLGQSPVLQSHKHWSLSHCQQELLLRLVVVVAVRWKWFAFAAEGLAVAQLVVASEAGEVAVIAAELSEAEPRLGLKGGKREGVRLKTD